MSTARISVLGLMRYDNTLFDEMVLPAAPWSKSVDPDIEAPDKETLVAHVLRRTANLEIFYPNMVTLKKAIAVWSKTNYYKFKKLWETIYYDYNPIWNKDAEYTEHERYDRNFGDDFTEGVVGTSAKSGDNHTSGTDTDNDTTTNRVSAFNVNGFQDKDQTILAANNNHSDTGNYTDNETYGVDTDNNRQLTGYHEIDRTKTERGNIGVTTTQQMIEAERQVALFNWYDVVCDSFIAEFCIDVY